MTRIRTSEPHLDQQPHTSDWQRDRMMPDVWADEAEASAKRSRRIEYGLTMAIVFIVTVLWICH